ncbi:hypothetical protein [Hoylesella loescheii]|uniref:hypothetical protein n=1 Tax=Hoylesella loescheii TaxID=840 RepID=UPI00248F084B|nr:hypothetical protein [Hoylesella loescheii]
MNEISEKNNVIKMDTDFIQQLQDIKSFTELKNLYQGWADDGVIQDRADLLQLGYVSLISYPSIYLNSEGTTEEIEAAKVCYDFWVKYGKEDIERKLNSEDKDVVLTTETCLLPPERNILMRCTEFFLLHYFLKGLYGKMTEKELSQVSGDDYAKVWLEIFGKGFHFQPIEQNVEFDRMHYNESLRLISKMQLSEMYRDEIKPEKLKDRFNDYYHVSGRNTDGKGCLVLIMVVLIASLMAVCSF